MTINRGRFRRMRFLIPPLCVPILLASFLAVEADIDFIAERLPLLGERPPPGSPWPMPRTWNRSEEVMTLNIHNLTLTSNLESCDLIQHAFLRFQRSLRTIDESLQAAFTDRSTDHSAHGGNASVSDGRGGGDRTTWVLRAEVVDLVCPGYPQRGMAEDYNLTVNSEILLQATSVWGVLRGLETCLQLMYTQSGHWYINRGLILDFPRYSHRGLLLDTARHFYSTEYIKTNLLAMAMNKLNVFHWHIVDAQSFPYQSIRYPELSQKGAFSRRHVYRQEDIREVIEHARLLGIRVIPEFDTPGHGHSWGKAMPELLTPCWAGGQSSQANYSYHAARENFDPSKNGTFDFLQEFFFEIRDVFPDSYLHMGMDEAHYMCWKSSPEIAVFMESMGFGTDYSALEGYYNTRLLSIVNGFGKSTIVWEDPLNNGVQLPESSLIQVWKGGRRGNWPEYLLDALNHGYDVILSSCWYLNYIEYGQDWKDFYTCDPGHLNVTAEVLSQVQGGEACVWSEYLDETNMMQTVWPRASAMAERLWSSPDLTCTNKASFRLDQHRCRMNRHGIPAQPILPGHCRDDYNSDNALAAYDAESDVTNVTDDVITPSPSVPSKATSTDSPTRKADRATPRTSSEPNSRSGSQALRSTLHYSLFPTFCLIGVKLFYSMVYQLYS